MEKQQLREEMIAHIEEFRLFQSLCTGQVHDDERGIAWLTWCIRNKETIQSKLLDVSV